MQFSRIFAIAALASASYVAASSQDSAITDALSHISDEAMSYIGELKSEHESKKASRSLSGRGERPLYERTTGGECSVGNVSCCNQMVSSHEKKKTLAGLLGLNDVVGQIGLDCANIPINVIGGAVAASNYCKSSPVCCNHVEQNGIVNIGCTSLPIN